MKICLRCGKESKDNIDYCPDCGRPIYKEKPVNAPIPEPERDASKEVGAVEVNTSTAETTIIESNKEK